MLIAVLVLAAVAVVLLCVLVGSTLAFGTKSSPLLIEQSGLALQDKRLSERA